MTHRSRQPQHNRPPKVVHSEPIAGQRSSSHCTQPNVRFRSSRDVPRQGAGLATTSGIGRGILRKVPCELSTADVRLLTFLPYDLARLTGEPGVPLLCVKSRHRPHSITSSACPCVRDTEPKRTESCRRVRPANVRFASLADTAAFNCDVRFVPIADIYPYQRRRRHWRARCSSI